MSLNKFGNSEVELQRVGGANACIRRQFTIFCAEPITVRLLRTLRLVTSDDIMTSLLNKLSISIKIHAVKPLYSVSILLTESVGSRRELVPNCVHSSQLHTADATKQFRRIGVGGVYWALDNSDLNCLSGREVSGKLV